MITDTCSQEYGSYAPGSRTLPDNAGTVLGSTLGSMHLIQYVDPVTGKGTSTVLCPQHRYILLSNLQALARNCITIPVVANMSKCDDCWN